MARISKEQLDELREDFAFNDGNEDGRIDFDEFCELLTDLDAEVSPDEALLGFHEIDTNGSGSISFDEFVAWWTSD
jgi:calmodulin